MKMEEGWSQWNCLLWSKQRRQAEMHSAITEWTSFFRGGKQINCRDISNTSKKTLSWLLRRKYLKENKVNQKKNETRTSEPKEVVPGLNNGNTLNDMAPFLNCQSHLGYDNMELRSHQ